MIHGLVGLFVLLVILGVGLHLVNKYLDMEEWVKQLLNTLVKIVVVVVIIMFLIGVASYFAGNFGHGFDY